MSISSIVNVQISAQTQTVTQPGFGQLLLVGLFKNWTDLIRMYDNMSGVAADFQPNQPEYIAAQNFFAQPITPPQLWIGRRTIDNAIINLETAMTGFLYTTTIQSTAYTVLSTSNSIVTFSESFVTGNFAQYTLNGVSVSGLTSVINFSIDFVASNSILATINGTPLTPTVFNTDQATTIAALASSIQSTGVGVATASVTGSDQITVVFTALSATTVNSVVTTLGATQPVATILTGTTYTSSSANTLTMIAASIAHVSATVLSSVASSGPPITITSTGITSAASPTSAVVEVNVTGGASQPVATTTTSVSVIPQMVWAIANDPTSDVVTVSGSTSDTYSLTSIDAGTPWSLSVSTNIVQPVNCQIQVLQAIAKAGYTVTIDGIPYTYTAPAFGFTDETISLGLAAVINADPNRVVNAYDNGNGTLELVSIIVESIQPTFSVYATTGLLQVNIGLIISPYSTSTSIATDLTAMNDLNDGWYGLALTDRTQATVLAAANWVEANTKLFGTASSDPNIINQAPGSDLTSIAYQLGLGAFRRTWSLYNQDAGNNQLPGPGLDYPECAWFSVMLSQNPGSNTWALKSLATIPDSDLTATQSANCRGKFCNTYEYIAGIGVTRNGVVAFNEYIDIIIGIDWLTSVVQSNVFNALVRNSKVPYTDSGITCIQAQIERALDQGVNQNFLASIPAYTVSVPKAANVSATDKANRTLNDVTFQATLAGAIQIVDIVGTLNL